MSAKDQRIAIVGLGYSKLAKDSGVGVGTLAAQASRNAIRDSGVSKEQIDAVIGVYSTDFPTVWPAYVVEALGLPNVTWWDSAQPPSVVALSQAVQAVQAGNATYALVYHAKYRWAGASIAANADRLRQPPGTDFDAYLWKPMHQIGRSSLWAARGMRRHMELYGSRREDFGMIAVNNRSYAVDNPRAVFRTPMSMDDYLGGAMIDDPMSLYDMDPPIDGSLAIVVTSAERAADLPHKPVFVEAFGASIPARNDGNQWDAADEESFRRNVQSMFARTDYTALDMDLAYPYDGFTILTMLWLEALYTAPGEGASLLRDAWSDEERKLRLFGRVPMCTNGGNLSEGRATQGFGGVLEAVAQLRGTAGDRQLPGGYKTAVITNGNSGTNRSTILSVE